jgi:hypothetical protein
VIQQNAECLGEQARQLAALLQQRESRGRSAKLAAQAIDAYLRARGERPIDLLELAGCIRQALGSAV